MEALQSQPSVYESIMSTRRIKANDVNGSRLAEQEPSSGRCSRQGYIDRHHVNPVINKRRKWVSQEDKIVMERIEMFRQNRMFQNNQKQFYSELNQEGERYDDDQQDTEESKKFYGGILEQIGRS